MTGSRPILVFTHIPKTAGMTMITVLRSLFGLTHCRATKFERDSADLGVYSRADLSLDLRVYPWLRAISGHPLRPFVDFGGVESRLTWVTMLRDPVERFVSHYRYYCARQGIEIPFEEWCATRGVRGANLQVRWLAGTEDVTLAKDMLVSRFACVGDQGDFDTSLALMAGHVRHPGFPTSVDWTVNESTWPDRPLDRELAASLNELDIELYDFFRAEVWPRQVTRLGGAPERAYVDTIPNRLRRYASLAYHGVVYKNVRRVAAWRRAAVPGRTQML